MSSDVTNIVDLWRYRNPGSVGPVRVARPDGCETVQSLASNALSIDRMAASWRASGTDRFVMVRHWNEVVM